MNIEIFKVDAQERHGVIGGKSVISARQMHFFIDSKRNFDDWFKYYCKRFGLVSGVDYVKISLRELKSTSNALTYNRGKFEKTTITNSVIVKKQKKNDPIGFDYALTLTSALFFASVFEGAKCAAIRNWIVAKQKQEVMDLVDWSKKRVAGMEDKLHQVGARLDAQEMEQMRSLREKGRSYRSHPNWKEIHRQVELCCQEYGIIKKEAFDHLYRTFNDSIISLDLNPIIYKTGRTDTHMQKIFDRGLSNRFLMMDINGSLWARFVDDMGEPMKNLIPPAKRRKRNLKPV